MHYHPTAMPIVAALYDVYKGADRDAKEEMLRALYYQGDKAAPESILEAFGLSDMRVLEYTMTAALVSAGLKRTERRPPCLTLS